jgi:hypothetical protein
MAAQEIILLYLIVIPALYVVVLLLYELKIFRMIVVIALAFIIALFDHLDKRYAEAKKELE